MGREQGARPAGAGMQLKRIGEGTCVEREQEGKGMGRPVQPDKFLVTVTFSCDWVSSCGSGAAQLQLLCQGPQGGACQACPEGLLIGSDTILTVNPKCPPSS